MVTSMAKVRKKKHEPAPGLQGMPERALDRLRSIEVQAERLGVSTFTVRRKIKNGTLKGVRVGRRLLIADSVVDSVIQNGCAE
jgi:excisionase family DNA binding protein